MTLAHLQGKEQSQARRLRPGDAKSIALLPGKLQELIARSVKLQAEVRQLDGTMHAAPPLKVGIGNPVERHWGC